MKLDEHSAALPSLSADSVTLSSLQRAGDWVEGELAASLLQRVGSGGMRLIARAPGRLDVFGGLSDYAGSHALVMPLSDYAVAALRPTDDGMLRVIGPEGPEVCVPITKLSAVLEPKQSAVLLANELFAVTPSTQHLAAIGTVFECVRAGILPTELTGFRLAVGSCLSGVTDGGESAAVAAATLATLLRWGGTESCVSESAKLIQAVENRWLARPVGVVDAMCALKADACLMTQMKAIHGDVAGTLAVPSGYTLLAIDSGVHRDANLVKYRAVRTAAGIGAYLIGRIIEHENRNGHQWEGWLAQLTFSEFAARFRDRLPRSMQGSDFLERFGQMPDPLAPVDSKCVYRVRSRTEHHVYEGARAAQFAQALGQVARTGRDAALSQIADSMYASHWSYGQRCGLGTKETDLLVKSLREQGLESDIVGAKITGRGAGGVVVVLTRDTQRAHAAVLRSAEFYQNKTGIEPAFLSLGDTAGVLHTGVKQI